MRSPTQRFLALVTLVALLGLAGVPGTVAQGDAPRNLTGAIFTGPCDTLGDTATYPAGDFIAVDEDTIIGYQQVPPVLRSQATLPAGLDALFQPQQVYSYVVRDNADPGGDPVACGELGGVQVNGQIVIGLFKPSPDDPETGELVGVAIFGNTTPTGPTTQPANAQNETPVQAYLYENALDGAETPTPMAPPPPPPTPTTAPASPTAAPTMAPTTSPTMMPTMTATATETATATATATETATSTATEEPTQEPTATEESNGG